MSTRTRTTAATLLAAGALLVPASHAFAVTKLSDASAASQLSAAGISRSSSGGCTSRYVSTCTSYDQINQSTVSGIITFKRASGCSVRITGGTETGHASGTYSHWNGYKVDIPRTSCTDSWITRTYTYIGVRGDGARMYKSLAGNIYAAEGTHWDITYYSCGGCRAVFTTRG